MPEFGEQKLAIYRPTPELLRDALQTLPTNPTRAELEFVASGIPPLEEMRPTEEVQDEYVIRCIDNRVTP